LPFDWKRYAGHENFEARYLKPALEAAFIERTIPGKPKSRLQKYRLKEKGREFAAPINFPAN
jgi:hypothetical protein